MKRIAIVGALWTSNFGDVLLAKLFVEGLRKNGCEVSLPNASKEVKSAVGVCGDEFSLAEADGVVFCGGGYFSEPPYRWSRWALSRYKLLYRYATYCKLVKKPYWILGVGAGPIRSPLSKLFIRHVCLGAEVVAVRDAVSVEAIRGVAGIEPVKVADYALSLKERITESREVKGRVGIHITKNGHRSIPGLLEYLSSRKELDIYFVEDHVGEYEKVVSVFPEIETICLGGVIKYRNVESFINSINELEYVVTNKLHVGIVGCALGKKVCSLPYHEKVERFYHEIGRPELHFSEFDSKSDYMAHLDRFFNSESVQLPIDLLRRARDIDNYIHDIAHGNPPMD